MFNDKKLKKTLWLAALAVVPPMCFLFFYEKINSPFVGLALLIGIPISFIASIKVLLKIMRNWKDWELLVKIIGIGLVIFALCVDFHVGSLVYSSAALY